MVKLRLVLEPAVVAKIRDARASKAPEEACGLLFGRAVPPAPGGGAVHLATCFVECENVLHSPSAFELDPVEHYQQLLAHQGEMLVGIVHTHPGARFVSPSDRRYMLGTASVARTCWIIAGAGRAGDDLDIGAYIVDGGSIVPVPVDIQ